MNDEIIFFEANSYLPIRSEFEFLRPKFLKKFSNGTQCFYLKKIKQKGIISTGLVMPKKMFPECDGLDLGTDVSKIIGVIKR